MKRFATCLLWLAFGTMAACTTPAPKTVQPESPKESPSREFYSKAFGFGLTKPEGWYLINDSVLQEDRNTIRLDDAELEKMRRQNPNIPLVVFTRHPEPYPTLNPSVAVTVSFLPVEGVPPVDAMKMSTEISRLGFPDLKEVEPPQPAVVSGMEGAYTHVTYTAMFADGQKFLTRTRMWIIPRGKIMFTIGMTGPQEGPDIFEDLYPQILKSVKIDPQP